MCLAATPSKEKHIDGIALLQLNSIICLVRLSFVLFYFDHIEMTQNTACGSGHGQIIVPLQLSCRNLRCSLQTYPNILKLAYYPYLSFLTLPILFYFQFPEFEELYCKYSFVYGQDWVITTVSI